MDKLLRFIWSCGAWDMAILHMVMWLLDIDISSRLEDISISKNNNPELIEECSHNLFGRLLLDRHQNLRALKSTLRSAWKMGFDLRIAEVGNKILQFKFNSMYQLNWVERNGPWNFDNNLLLLTLWR